MGGKESISQMMLNRNKIKIRWERINLANKACQGDRQRLDGRESSSQMKFVWERETTIGERELMSQMKLARETDNNWIREIQPRK